MPHSLIDIPAEVFQNILLPVLRARLDATDLVSLSLTCRTLSSALRPTVCETVTFTAGSEPCLARLKLFLASGVLDSFVEKLVFCPSPAGVTQKTVQRFWLAFTVLLARLVGLRTIVCLKGAMPSDEFWRVSATSASVRPTRIEIHDGFKRGFGPPPRFYKLRGLSSLRFFGDHGRKSASHRVPPSRRVREMVFRNRHTLQELEIHSGCLYLDEILVPSLRLSDAPTFPALTSLNLTANYRGSSLPPLFAMFSHGSAFFKWFQDLLSHLPKLDTLTLHPGARTARSRHGHLVPSGSPLWAMILGPNPPQGTWTITYRTGKVNPLTETCRLPRFLPLEAAEHLRSVRKLVLMRPPLSKGCGRSEVEYVPLGKKDRPKLFPAFKELKALEELSVTLGEVDVEILSGLADAVGGGKLRSLEIDLRVLKKTNVEADEDEYGGDGLLWADELAPFAAALSPLARSLVTLVVADNKPTAARALLADADRDPSNQDAFDFLPTLLVFAHQLWNLTSVRWITRDGRNNDACLRDQLWVAAVGGGWMRLVG